MSLMGDTTAQDKGTVSAVHSHSARQRRIEFVGGAFSMGDSTARDKRYEMNETRYVSRKERRYQEVLDSKILTGRRPKFEIGRERDIFRLSTRAAAKWQLRSQSNKAAAQFRDCGDGAWPCSVRRGPAV